MKPSAALALIALFTMGVSTAVDARDRGERPARPDFSSIDSDGNGVIDITEFSAQELPPGVDDAQEIFDQLDADQDGEITEEEFASHKPQRRQR